MFAIAQYDTVPSNVIFVNKYMRKINLKSLQMSIMSFQYSFTYKLNLTFLSFYQFWINLSQCKICMTTKFKYLLNFIGNKMENILGEGWYHLIPNGESLQIGENIQFVNNQNWKSFPCRFIAFSQFFFFVALHENFLPISKGKEKKNESQRISVQYCPYGFGLIAMVYAI